MNDSSEKYDRTRDVNQQVDIDQRTGSASNEAPNQPPVKPNPERTKLQSSIQSLQETIGSTEDQLSKTLQKLSQLKTVTAEPSLKGPSRPQGLPAPVVSNSGSPVQTKEEEQATLQHAQAIIARHIYLLKSYNEIKDVAMGMLSIIAEKEGRRLVDVMEERGVSEKD